MKKQLLLVALLSAGIVNAETDAETKKEMAAFEHEIATLVLKIEQEISNGTINKEARTNELKKDIAKYRKEFAGEDNLKRRSQFVPAELDMKLF